VTYYVNGLLAWQATKLITFFCLCKRLGAFFVGQPRVKQGMDDQLYHAFTFDPSKSLLQRYIFFRLPAIVSTRKRSSAQRKAKDLWETSKENLPEKT
jgi:hypothetical protein